MIKETSNQTEIAGIRALSDDEIEATSGAGFWSDLWDGIVGAVEFVVGLFNGPPAPWRGPFGNRPY